MKESAIKEVKELLCTKDRISSLIKKSSITLYHDQAEVTFIKDSPFDYHEKIMAVLKEYLSWIENRLTELGIEVNQ